MRGKNLNGRSSGEEIIILNFITRLKRALPQKSSSATQKRATNLAMANIIREINDVISLRETEALLAKPQDIEGRIRDEIDIDSAHIERVIYSLQNSDIREIKDNTYKLDGQMQDHKTAITETKEFLQQSTNEIREAQQTQADEIEKLGEIISQTKEAATALQQAQEKQSEEIGNLGVVIGKTKTIAKTLKKHSKKLLANTNVEDQKRANLLLNAKVGATFFILGSILSPFTAVLLKPQITTFDNWLHPNNNPSIAEPTDPANYAKFNLDIISQQWDLTKKWDSPPTPTKPNASSDAKQTTPTP